VARVIFTFPLGFVAFTAYAFLVIFWELVSRVPQYQMRLAKDDNSRERLHLTGGPAR